MGKSLDDLRIELNKIDAELIELLAKRMKVVEQVGTWKKENGHPILDPRRWDEVLSTKMRLGADAGINPEMVRDIWDRIHEEALDIEMKLGQE